MKSLSVVGVATLLCVVAVHTAQSSSLTGTDLREFIKCVDGVFGEMVEEHIKLEKYHSDFKILAKETSAEVDKCEGKTDEGSKKVCFENTIVKFSMLKLSEMIDEMSEESKVLFDLFTRTVADECDNRN